MKKRGWRGVALLALCLGLAGCDGGRPTPIPDYGTPAPETPGPVTAAEEQYITSVTQYLSQFILPDYYTHLALETENPRGPQWAQRVAALYNQDLAVADAADAIQAPPRLRAIDEHYRVALSRYRRLLIRDRDTTLIMPSPTPQLATAPPKAPLSPGGADLADYTVFDQERSRVLTLFTGFRLRHLPPTSTP